MKTVTTELHDIIRESHNVEAKPVLIAEWNLNRYHNVVPDNTPAETDNGRDVELFPIESIVSANRPPAGIAKAIINEARVTANYTEGAPSRRWYLASKNSVYKYWQSPVSSNSTTSNFPNHTDGFSVVRPRVEFFEDVLDFGDPDDDETPKNCNVVDGVDVTPAPLVPKGIYANMIVVGLENGWSSPDDWSVQVKTSAAGAYTNIATNPTIDSEGRVKLYFNTGTTWDQTERFTGGTTIWGIQLVVRSMDKPKSFFNLIELSPRLTRDVSADLISESDNFDLGEADHLTPMGTLSANTAEVTLFNGHKWYSPQGVGGPYAGLIDRNVEFRYYYDFKKPSGTERVQQFKMFADEWEEDFEAAQVQVNLADFSKYLQETKPKPVLYREVPVQEAVWRLLDSVGFNDYEVEIAEDSPSSRIHIFWTTGEETIWEVFQELSRATQCAIYFDSRGILQVKTRKAAFNTAKSTTWTARQFKNGVELPDIISLSADSAYDANKVTINYIPTDYEPEKNGFAKMEIVWEPEDTVTLRANDLQRDITSTSAYIYVSPRNVKTWPFKGMVNIEGEFMEYNGKRLVYYDGTTKKQTTVYSEEEKAKMIAKGTVLNKDKAHYTGGLVICKRAMWNSEKKDHKIDLTGWTTQSIKRGSGAPVVKNNVFNVHHNKKDSTVTIKNPKKWGWEDISMMFRGNSIDQGYWYMGTKFKFNKGAFKDDIAGIAFNMDGPGDGYFLEVTPTVNITGKERKSKNELRFYSIKGTNDKKYFGGEQDKLKDKSKDHKHNPKLGPPKGSAQAVVENVWVELDIKFEVLPNGDHKIWVDFNGVPSLQAVVPQGSGWQHNRVSKFGLYARGHTSATFEYIYGINNLGQEKVDSIPYLDRIQKGFYGQQWIRDWVYKEKNASRWVKKHTNRDTIKYAQRVYDEFGPIVHEIREMEVKFDVERPVIQSRLFSTNEVDAVCTEYSGNAWGAKFTIANTSRANAVMHGEDNLTTPGNTIDQKLIIFGRPVVTKDEGKITRKDKWSIRRRGEIETEFSNKWIQSKNEAEQLGNWLVEQWARGESELELELFGNPLIELTDVISVQYDDLTAPDDRFFVTAVSSGFDNGITTNVTLRRA